jgi:CoA:oxalate CoA-transferase
MIDCLFSLLFDDPIDWYERLGIPVRQGNRILRFSPVNTYQAADGWVVLGAATTAQWRGMLQVIGRADLSTIRTGPGSNGVWPTMPRSIGWCRSGRRP